MASLVVTCTNFAIKSRDAGHNWQRAESIGPRAKSKTDDEKSPGC